MATLDKTLRKTYEWAVKRVDVLSKKNIDDARAIQSELGEWLDPNVPDLEIFSLDYIGEEE